ncbi:hypothetical protein HC891_10615 [Candidatus Gracilibacteria bacterium]|nr:hypothetical protein [Candidatus Gracilibacteria bacterium]
MPTTSELDRVLEENTSKEIHELLTVISDTIIAFLDEEISPEATSTILSSRQELQIVYEQLQNKSLQTADSLIDFGINNQVGDITIRDVAKGSIVKININAQYPNSNPREPETVFDLLIEQAQSSYKTGKNRYLWNLLNPRREYERFLQVKETEDVNSLYRNARLLQSNRDYFMSALYWRELIIKDTTNNEHRAYLELCLSKLNREENIASAIISLWAKYGSSVSAGKITAARTILRQILALLPKNESFAEEVQRVRALISEKAVSQKQKKTQKSGSAPEPGCAADAAGASLTWARVDLPDKLLRLCVSLNHPQPPRTPGKATFFSPGRSAARSLLASCCARSRLASDGGQRRSGQPGVGRACKYASLPAGYTCSSYDNWTLQG